MKEEWKNIASSTWIKIVLVAIIAIPMLYSGIFLGSMWDPYGNADKIPVAVVNNDEQVSYNGKNLDVGKELVKNLKENKSMDFKFVSAKDAKAGLEEGTYYMVITIPEDFSSNATTLLDKEPKKMELEYSTNPGTNYIASKMDETAISKIRESVSATVTQTYADTLFSSVQELSSGLNDASDGTKKIASGIDQTMEGNQTIEANLKKLASSSLTFSDGAVTLQQGLSDYVNGVSAVNAGATQLNEGISTLNGKSTVLANGVHSLQQGSTQLNSGIQAYTTGVSSLLEGTQKLSVNNDALNKGAVALAQGTSQLKNGSSQLLAGLNQASAALDEKFSPEQQQSLQQLMAANEARIQATNDPALKQQLMANNAAIQTLVSGLSDVKNQMEAQGTTPETMGLIQSVQMIDQGLASADAALNGDQGLVNGIQNYTAGVSSLQAGAEQLASKSNELINGSAQLNDGTSQLNASIPALTQGIQQLSDGSASLVQGTDQLVGNNNKLLDGTAQLSDGSVQISDGASQLADGSTTLQSALSQLKDGTGTLDSSLADGAKKSQLSTNEKTKEMLAQPVETNHEELTTVNNNGTAMAPYMMSVGLYVACMAFTLMYPLLKNTGNTKSGWKMWLSKASVMYVISTLSAIVMISILMLVNGLEPLMVAQTFLMAILVSAGFMSMIVFFNITCGKIGSFIVLIFMVLQLGGAAGTYPIETSSSFFNTIHPFMPFSYSVHAFRNTLAIGGNISSDIALFAGMIIVFSILSVLFYRWKVSISEEQFEKTPLAQFH